MRLPKGVVFLAVLAISGIAAYATKDLWKPGSSVDATQSRLKSQEAVSAREKTLFRVSTSARRNLRIESRPVLPQRYWRTIDVPGEIVDRPGHSDRGVTSPAVGVVTAVHAFPGDTLKSGDRLFTLQLFSEYLQNTQSELFRSTREVQLITEQRVRLEGLIKGGGIPESRLLDLDNQLRRQTALIQSHQQDLLTRGLSPEQIRNVAEGIFVSTIDVVAPPVPAVLNAGNPDDLAPEIPRDDAGELLEESLYEVQELNVELGQQVQAGQLLSTLSNHRELFIEGHAFKREASSLARAAENRWPIRCTFAEDDGADWPAFEQHLEIRHLANSLDPETRTFAFFIPLKNQSRSYQRDGESFLVWRYRPGQRVRLQVPVEELQDVIVLPAAALVREGAEAYVFQQSGGLFQRLSVHVLHEDSSHVVLAADGSIRKETTIAQNAAASLHRILKAQSAGGESQGFHVHADGTVHASH